MTRRPHPATTMAHPVAAFPDSAGVRTNYPTSRLPDPTPVPDPVTFDPDMCRAGRDRNDLHLRRGRRVRDDCFARAFPADGAAGGARKADAREEDRPTAF